MRWTDPPTLGAASVTRLENPHQTQNYKQQEQRGHQHENRPGDQELLSRLRREAIIIGKFGHFRAEIFAEIEAVSKVENNRPNVPIPAVSAKAAQEAQSDPQLKTTVTQSSFPIDIDSDIAIFVEFVHRQQLWLAHELVVHTYPIPDGIAVSYDCNTPVPYEGVWLKAPRPRKPEFISWEHPREESLQFLLRGRHAVPKFGGQSLKSTREGNEPLAISLRGGSL